MFEQCQNCHLKPASLHCLTCESLPRYSRLCYGCDSKIHARAQTRHAKEFIKLAVFEHLGEAFDGGRIGRLGGKVTACYRHGVGKGIGEEGGIEGL
jgi:hypothetical protein